MAVNYGLGGFKNGAAYAYGVASGVFNVTIPRPLDFYVFDEDIILGSYLEVSTLAGVLTCNLAGYYFIKYSVTTSGASGDDLQLGIAINGVVIDGGSQYFYSNNGDEFTTNSSTITKIDGDMKIQLAVQNLSTDQDVTIESYNISIIRVGDLETTSNLFLAGTSFMATIFNNIASPTNLTFAATNTFYPIIDNNVLVSSQNMGTDAKLMDFIIRMDGFYVLDASITTEGSSNDDLTLGILKNGDAHADALAVPQQKYTSKGGTLWQTGLNGIFELKIGDTLQLALQNNTDTTGTTKISSINKSLSRIGNI
tara:strand:- start:168 stop:1097 length:930 start_codon:yes stop_codon:yes gene_type:complete